MIQPLNKVLLLLRSAFKKRPNQFITMNLVVQMIKVGSYHHFIYIGAVYEGLEFVAYFFRIANKRITQHVFDSCFFCIAPDSIHGGNRWRQWPALVAYHTQCQLIE